MSEKLKSNRRQFFTNTFKKSKEVVYSAIDAGLKIKFRRKIIRPPGAIIEDQFLVTCTRCDNCVTACPYKAIHLVTQVHSGVLFKTPFIDPKHEACRFCEDMPCIEACTDNALIMPEDKLVKPIGIAVLNPEHCLVNQGQHCDYCYNSCPNGLKAINKDAKGAPIIDTELCNGCGKCSYICVSQSGDALVIKPL